LGCCGRRRQRRELGDKPRERLIERRSSYSLLEEGEGLSQRKGVHALAVEADDEVEDLVDQADGEQIARAHAFATGGIRALFRLRDWPRSGVLPHLINGLREEPRLVGVDAELALAESVALPGRE
jgi:hypothetical protein